ncbi:hypothetical protein BGZ95_008540 [Linnemannia exigua]|uniref:Fork-head domain-containing protein n=1 Tax=Linnemannia exigua TaxID=604196 RepID=A0AAD4DEE0_9FUNG|nr:hypothetical protein BGZ95_008540 [Linnemannia exigua]
MSTPPLSPSAKSPTHATSPQASKRRLARSELSKPNESWFLILVNAFKSNFEQTLTYRESELYAWIMQAYPYYRHDMHTMQTSVKTTLSSYECFRQNGRSTWTFIPRRALVHLESLKSEEGRRGSDGSGDEGEEELEDEDEEILVHDQVEDSSRIHYPHNNNYSSHEPPTRYEHHQDGPSDTRIRYMDRTIDVLDAADSPTLSVEEIQRFKQEHSGAQARKLKRKASGGHASRPRTRSPPAALQDECSMSMEAWCNLLVQMFEASPKQKTIREIYAWVHDNYPIYQNAPGDAWQADLTAALESNPLFRAMGRGRWQMATQPVQPVVIVNGTAVASGSGSASNLSVKAEDDATDSPSVTEDEDWKAIGSKRLLNFSFRRYSIATDTFPKGHYKVGSTMPAGSNLYPSSTSNSNATIATASTSSSVTATTSSGMLLPLDHRPSTYTTARRFSSFHQPTPKNSPPLSATTAGLPTVDEFGSQLSNALSEETEDEDPTKRYMAPLQSAINSAVLALQTQTQQDQNSASRIPPPQPSMLSHQHANKPNHYEYSQQHTPTTPSITVQDTSAAQVSYGPEQSHSSPESPAEQVPRPEPEIVIPNGEDLASDQMDAIQALALLCGGGV